MKKMLLLAAVSCFAAAPAFAQPYTDSNAALARGDAVMSAVTGKDDHSVSTGTGSNLSGASEYGSPITTGGSVSQRAADNNISSSGDMASSNNNSSSSGDMASNSSPSSSTSSSSSSNGELAANIDTSPTGIPKSRHMSEKQMNLAEAETTRQLNQQESQSVSR